MPSVEVTVQVGLPAEPVWAALVDWPGHAAWMPMTTVEVVGGSGQAVGDRILARTGLGPLALPDRMTITEFSAPRRLVVTKTGPLLTGSAAFEVRSLPAGRCVVVWREDLDLPFGRWGRAASPVLSPILAGATRIFFGRAMRRFARQVEQGQVLG